MNYELGKNRQTQREHKNSQTQELTNLKTYELKNLKNHAKASIQEDKDTY